MAVNGSLGEKMKIAANFDSNNSFDFQNQLKLEYDGFDEDILQSVEIGNVSMPIQNRLIQGAQNLFGVKTQITPSATDYCPLPRKGRTHNCKQIQ